MGSWESRGMIQNYKSARMGGGVLNNNKEIIA